jgi:type III pantothenate kinase
MIEGLVTRMQKEFGNAMTVVATGGLASLFAAVTDVIGHTDRERRIRGLREVYLRNRAA